MKPTIPKREGVITLKSLVKKLQDKWIYFVIALFFTLGAAFLYNKFSTKIYRVQASILLKEETTGSLGADELFKLLPNATNKTGKKIEDQIGIITSYNTVEAALKKLNFGVSYYTEGIFSIQEQYDNFPIGVIVDSSSTYMVDVPIYVEVLSEDKYLLKIDAEDVKLYDIKENRIVSGLIPSVSIEKEGRFGEPFTEKYLSFTVNKTDEVISDDNKELFFKIHSLESLVKNYQKKLEVAQFSSFSNILTLGIEGPIVNKDVDFLNAVMDAMVQTSLHEKDQKGFKTISFIDAQLATIADSLAQTENNLESFRTQNNLVNIGSQSNNMLERLSYLEGQRAEIRTRLNDLRNINSYLNSNKGLSNVSATMASGIDDPVFNSLIMELIQLNQQKAGLNLSVQTGNPLLEQIEAKTNEIRSSLEEILKNLINSANTALTDYNNQINILQANVNKIPKSERQLVGIERKFSFNDETYNFLMEKKVQAGIALATNTPDVNIVNVPRMVGNGPVSSQGSKIYMMAFLLGLLIPTSLILFKDALNDKITGKDDIKEITNIPLLGFIPFSEHKDPKVVYNHPRSATAESFRSVRSNLNFFNNTNGSKSKVILLTSNIPKEGKTFCSINLTAVFAMAGEKTILLEFDLRKPTVSKVLNVSNGLGLSEYLSGNASLKEIIYKVPDQNFYVISAGAIPPNPSELILRDRTKELFQMLKQEFDIIVVDSPPVGLVTDASILQNYSDKNIMICRQDHTTKEMLGNAQELYDDNKIKNLSLILNGTTTAKKYSYYEE